MRYDYRCKEHGVLELSHSMKENRDKQICPECSEALKPLISSNVSILLTGRPPWAYNDVFSAAEAGEESANSGSEKGRNAISGNTTISDNRDGSKYKGQKVKMKDIKKSGGIYNAQW